MKLRQTSINKLKRLSVRFLKTAPFLMSLNKSNIRQSIELYVLVMSIQKHLKHLSLLIKRTCKNFNNINILFFKNLN